MRRVALLGLLLLLLSCADASFLLGDRLIPFRTLDTQRAAQSLRDYPRAFSNWGAAEWAAFDLPPLRLSVQSATPTDTTAGGARIIYFADQGMDEVGGIEVVATESARYLLQPWTSPGLLVRPLPGARKRGHEDVMFVQLLREVENGLLSRLGEPAPRLQLVSGKTRRTLGRIAGACAYDKAVRKRY